MDVNEVIDVSDDHILLQQVMEGHDINVKQLAMLTGYAASTIYKYLAGGQTIPSIIWRQLYKKTADCRIVKLITGDMAVAVVALVPIKVDINAPTLQYLVRTRKQQLRCEEYILRILEDGKVDESDRQMIQEYKKGFMDMVIGQSQIFQAITGEFDLNDKETRALSSKGVNE